MASTSSPSAGTKRPNFLVIVADDLGFSDIGCYGAEIATPHLDNLAKDGVKLLNFHTAAACSPTRAMLLTGTDAHLAGMGTMLEYKGSEYGSKRWGGKPGHEGYLNKDVATISEMLQDDGYYTCMSGKWHLGLRTDHGPQDRGFNRSFSLLPGCCNHYGWEPLRDDGSSNFPMAGRPLHTENGKRADVVANKTEHPNGFFSSTTYTDRLLTYLDERTPEEREKPFFAYLAYSAPHFPIQAPKEYREKYRGKYSDGPEALRQKRLARLVELAIIDKSVVPHEVVGTQGVQEWDSMDDYQKLSSARCMETYAAMVEHMDDCIGRVVKKLKEDGDYDNTTIIFMSDNGAEGASLEAQPVLGDKIVEAIKKYYDNSPDNIGAYNSFTWIGPEWAQASTAPSRLYKCFPSEGGILVPCIVKCPKFSSQHQCGNFDRAFTTCMDVVPTLLQMAKTTFSLDPANSKKMMHRGKSVHGIRGASWLPYFQQGIRAQSENAEAAVHPDSTITGWELFARAALRKGDWKIVHLPKAYGGNGAGDGAEGWELFNLRQDPGETDNLASKLPDKLAELLQCWETYCLETGTQWGASAITPGLSKELAPYLHDNAMEQTVAWMSTKPGQVPAFK